METPNLFISYSWSSLDHERWVMDLASQLAESGVNVVFDKWDLREGHDSISFMERMVNDPKINKVAIISDRTYAEKANGRAGGVGTETSIISKKVYDEQDQEKFVVIIPPREEDGHIHVPTYYSGRIHIDLSRSERYGEEFERLLRWLFNKPLNVRPELGRPPAFLNDEAGVTLGTGAVANRVIEAIKAGRPNAVGFLSEYFEIYSSNMEKFRIGHAGEAVGVDDIVKSIESFFPYRNEFVRVMTAVAQYMPTDEAARITHRFFEGLVHYMDQPSGRGSYSEWDFDNFRFIVNELYVLALAILLKRERFEFADTLISTPYYVAGNARGDSSVLGFSVFRERMGSSDALGKLLKKSSARAELLKTRAETSGFDFQDIMQVDFILFLRGELEGDRYSYWWPDTLHYAGHSYRAFEIFARSISKAYFDRVRQVLGVDSLDVLKSRISDIASSSEVPRFGYSRLDIKALSGFDFMGTKL